MKKTYLLAFLIFLLANCTEFAPLGGDKGIGMVQFDYDLVENPLYKTVETEDLTRIKKVRLSVDSGASHVPQIQL
jgi:hypothetical protein